jgi:nanoRNase/pAp phosphatase (c-di-AMP/oligoRNAs hydrolase)
MADERSMLEGIETAFVFGIVGDNIEVCVRSVNLSVDVNSLCQKLFGKEYAGGKMGSGAAKIPMGFLSVSGSSDDMREKMWESVKDFVTDKIFYVMSGEE